MRRGFRQIMDLLEDTGDLVRIKREVDPKFEMSAIMKKLEAENKAFIFENIKNADMPAVGGLFTSMSRIGLIFNENTSEEFTLDDAGQKVIAAIENPTPTTEVDVSSVELGKTITVLWRGKPIFIRRRTKEEIEEASAVDLKDLKDPEKDEDRAKNPEWLVMVGVCTHLGCIPLGEKGEYNGWFCPCHGSHYDTSGRVRKGPAPNNLEIPKYEFIDNNIIKIG